VLLNCDYFIKECYRDFPKSGLQYLATAAIKKNKKKAVKISRKESLFVTNPACIAGVFSTLPSCPLKQQSGFGQQRDLFLLIFMHI